MSIKVGTNAPNFQLPADDGTRFELASRKGQKVLLVFYPGDETPVCTAQLCDYRDGIESFSDLGVEVIGISKDSALSHQRFKAKRDLPFLLLTDANLLVAKTWGAAGVMGMKRAVFLIDEEQVVRYAHVEALALFRRSADELLSVIAQLSSDQT